MDSTIRWCALAFATLPALPSFADEPESIGSIPIFNSLELVDKWGEQNRKLVESFSSTAESWQEGHFFPHVRKVKSSLDQNSFPSDPENGEKGCFLLYSRGDLGREGSGFINFGTEERKYRFTVKGTWTYRPSQRDTKNLPPDGHSTLKGTKEYFAEGLPQGGLVATFQKHKDGKPTGELEQVIIRDRSWEHTFGPYDSSRDSSGVWFLMNDAPGFGKGYNDNSGYLVIFYERIKE